MKGKSRNCFEGALFQLCAIATMEAREEGAQVALALRVPGFLGYTPQTQTVVTCDHVVRVGGITAKFRISLNLYATRRLKTWSAQNPGETTPGRATDSPTRGHGLHSFPQTSTKTTAAGRNAFSPASLKGPKGFQPDKPQCLRNTPTSLRNTPTRNPCSGSDSPRTKSGLRDLYTYGGIAEVIYNRGEDSEVPTIGGKNTTSQHKLWGGGQEETIRSDEGDQLDVCVEVVCLHTTAPWQLLRHVQIRTSIEDRSEQQRDLVYDCGPASGPEPPVSRWCGVLVPRISLKSYGLLRGGALNASVIFDLPSEVLQSSSDTLLSLTDDMRHLLESCQTSADALLVTSDGGRVPAHLAILKARSSLLSTCTILNQTTCDIGIMVDGRSPVARSGGTGVGSIGRQRHVGVDDFQKKNALKVSECENFSEDNGVNLSSEFSSNSESDDDRKPDSSVQSPKPNKISQNFKNSPLKLSSGFTQHAGFSSPSKLTSSERLALFRKVEKTPTPVARSPLARINQHRFSPSKMRAKSQNLNSKLKKATRDLNECFIDCNEASDVSLTSTLTLKTNDSVFPADDTTVINIENDLKENFNNMNIQHNFTRSDDKKVNTVPEPIEDGRVLIKVHMSTSVTKHFLEWIYTGECRSLPTMCRPLLAAGRRHGVQELAAAAERHLVAGLSTSTAAATLLLAHTYQAWHLLQEALAFVKDHAEEVTQTEDWERVVNKCPDLALKLTRMMTSN